MGYAMGDPPNRATAAEREASQWFTRLQTRLISTSTLEEFRLWRSVPAHDEAYRRVEAMWSAAGTLQQDPAIDTAIASALNRRRLSVRRHTSATWAAGIAAGLALMVGTWIWHEGRGQFTTEIGEQRLVQLADGSSVRLDTASSMKVRFDGDRRLIDLESGQALFTVAHDPTRPFIVRSGKAEVTAIGTVFDVRRQGDGALVTLVQGVVDVARSGRPVGETRRLTVGDQARIASTGPAVVAVDPVVATSWVEGRLVFKGARLDQAVAEVNRYLVAPITLDASVTDTTRVNGVFKTGDREAFVAAVSDMFGLKVEVQSDGGVRLMAHKEIMSLPLGQMGG
jgi:transmembrane sensor